MHFFDLSLSLPELRLIYGFQLNRSYAARESLMALKIRHHIDYDF
jgi:hypothetical protein